MLQTKWQTWWLGIYRWRTLNRTLPRHGSPDRQGAVVNYFLVLTIPRSHYDFHLSSKNWFYQKIHNENFQIFSTTEINWSAGDELIVRLLIKSELKTVGNKLKNHQAFYFSTIKLCKMESSMRFHETHRKVRSGSWIPREQKIHVRGLRSN